MIPLPAALGGRDLVAWRLDLAIHAAGWNSGEGAFRVGGRWNSIGVRAVYCSLDPATTILELAVHKGFRPLDTQRHILTACQVLDLARVHIVQADDLPNPHWLHPGAPSAGQQTFGDALLAAHDFVALPSVVSRHSWNLIFDAARAVEGYRILTQEPFALDPRLHPPGQARSGA